ncbi:MAG: hypothetical protein ACJ746_24820 [Bryobacteraceae bacterium]
MSNPRGIAVSGSDLFVVNAGNGKIGKYTTAGDTVNPALISGLSQPERIAVSGSDLFVVANSSKQWHDRQVHHLGGPGEPRPRP